MPGMTTGLLRTAASAALRAPAPQRQQQARRQLTSVASAKDAVPSFPFSRPSDYQPPKEYAELRTSKCPFRKSKLWDGSDIWLITRHKDLTAVLSDDRFSKVRTHPNFPEMSPGGKEAAKTQTATFVDMDPPEHTKFRGMVAAWFTPEKAQQMRPSIQATADELAEELMRKGKPVDLAENFSMPLAFKVIYEMLGIPFTDYKYLSDNVAVRSSGSSTARNAAAAAQDLTDYMDRLVAAKEKEPKQDIISDLIQNQLKPGHCTREQLVATAFLLLVAGNATVASMINLGVLTLLQHPDQLAALKKDPSLMHSASEEILRYHTASSYALRRVAKQDVPMAGGQVVIRKDEGLIALNQSANRDESVFPDPDRFDIRRANNPHVAFGSGTHVCIAEWLSRVELECALTALFIHKIPGLKLAVPFDKVEYSDPSRDVGVKSLPVTW